MAAASVFATLCLALGVFLAHRCCGDREALGWLLAAALPTLYVLWAFARALPHHLRATQTPLPFAPSTGASLLRGLICAWLIGVVGTRLSAAELGWGPSVGLLAAAVLDHLDGKWARASGTASEMGRMLDLDLDGLKIGRASCRERVCQYV